MLSMAQENQLAEVRGQVAHGDLQPALKLSQPQDVVGGRLVAGERRRQAGAAIVTRVGMQ